MTVLAPGARPRGACRESPRRCRGSLAVLPPRAAGARAHERQRRIARVFYILPVQAPVLTATLAKALSTVLPDVDVRFVERGRGEFVTALQQGDVDVTILFADIAYLAFVGQLDGQPSRSAARHRHAEPQPAVPGRPARVGHPQARRICRAGAWVSGVPAPARP